VYVTTCSVTFQLRSQTVPDSEQPSEKRGLNCGELRDRYTDPPRGTAKELGYPCPEGHVFFFRFHDKWFGLFITIRDGLSLLISFLRQVVWSASLCLRIKVSEGGSRLDSHSKERERGNRQEDVSERATSR